MIVSIILITLISIIMPLLIYFIIETFSSTDSKIQQLEELESLNTFSAEVNNLTDAESISKILNCAHSEINYKFVSTLTALEDEAKPCPICGKKPRIHLSTDYSLDFEERVKYSIGCSRLCGQIWSGFDIDLLIMSWNRYAEGTITRTTIKPKSTNCPNCGAPIDIHAEKCAYCDTPYIDDRTEYAQTFDGRRFYFK